MGPYIMLATALVLLGMAAWLWELGEARGEPARLLLVWIAFSAVTALIAAAGMWIEDASMGQSFTAASRTYYMIAAFILFLFARSFSVGIDFTVLYWSVPLQLGLAGIIINWQSMFELRGGAKNALTLPAMVGPTSSISRSSSSLACASLSMVR